MIGAPHCRSVESRSSFVAWEGGFSRLLRRGIASVVGEISHRVTMRPCRATPACRSTSRSCACAPVNSSPPPLADIAAQHTTSLSENGRAFLRHRGVLLRRGDNGRSFGAMEPTAPSLLSHWESFYVIVGSSAGGLTGLMFVVIALVAESSLRRNTQSINAFGTPNVIHFLAVLFIAAILSAPWQRMKDPAHIIGLRAPARGVDDFLFVC